MNYGIPYMGSKSIICESVCRLFSKADNFYDLFGGGFSITHFMLNYRSKDFKQFHFNELRTGICELIQDAIAGKYNYKCYSPPWVSREDFFRLKEVDPMVKMIWSFGNNGRTYLLGKDIEQGKKSMHMAVVFNEFDDFAKEVFGMEKFKEGFGINEKRLFLSNRIKLLGKDRLDIQQLKQLQQLERIEQLQQLERLERLERLSFYNGSYDQVKIKENSVIYCDIPYGGTGEYDNSKDSFNRKKFFEWADAQNNPVFISEYNVEDSRFVCIANFKKRSLLCPNKDNNLVKTEKVYVNKSGYAKLLSRSK
jgi:hypothetical protein